MDDARKNPGPRLNIELGGSIVFAIAVIGSGIGVAMDASNSGAWFGFVASTLGFLLCIPGLISALRSRQPRRDK